MAKKSKIRSKSNHDNKKPCEMIISSGNFSYRFLWNWAKIPEYLKLNLISGVTCDTEGNVYALNRSGVYPIVVFNKDGNVIKELCKDLKYGRVHGAYMTKDQKIWFADDGAHVVRKIDLEGNLLKTIGSFGCPSDTGCDATLPSPELCRSIKKVGAPFNRPTKAVEGPKGDIYVSDGYANVAIHHFSPEGKLIKTWGGVGKEHGHFARPHGIWIDIKNRVWVADRENDRVQIFTAEGVFLNCIDDLLFPTDFWSDGTYMYVGELDGRMSIFDMDLKLVSQIGFAGSQLCVHAISGNSKGDLYVCIFRGEYYLAKLERIRR